MVKERNVCNYILNHFILWVTSPPQGDLVGLNPSVGVSSWQPWSLGKYHVDKWTGVKPSYYKLHCMGDSPTPGDLVLAQSLCGVSQDLNPDPLVNIPLINGLTIGLYIWQAVLHPLWARQYIPMLTVLRLLMLPGATCRRRENMLLFYLG